MTPVKRYSPGAGSSQLVTLNGLKRLGRERQVQTIVTWFDLQYVADPATISKSTLNGSVLNSLPLNGWLDLRSVLAAEFSPTIADDRIDEAMRRISSRGAGAWFSAFNSQTFGTPPLATAPLGTLGLGNARAEVRIWDESTWDDGTLWSDGTGWKDDDLPRIIAELEAGTRLKFGDDEETTRRQDLLRALGELQAAADSIRASGIGHNSGRDALDALGRMDDATSQLRAAVLKKTPDALEAGKQTSRLKGLAEIVAKEVGKEALKELALKPLLPHIVSAVKAAVRWLLALIA